MSQIQRTLDKIKKMQHSTENRREGETVAAFHARVDLITAKYEFNLMMDKLIEATIPIIGNSNELDAIRDKMNPIYQEHIESGKEMSEELKEILLNVPLKFP